MVVNLSAQIKDLLASIAERVTGIDLGLPGYTVLVGPNGAIVATTDPYPHLRGPFGRYALVTAFDTKGGFANINVDLMFAIPTQTMDHWRTTLRDAIALGSEHLSCYEVIYEDDTPLFAQLQAGEFSVDEELTEAMYAELVTTVEANGFRQYEVANFARDRAGLSTFNSQLATPPSLACRHNVNYWRGGQFHALGPSAAGYVRGVRTKNWSNTQLYCEQLEKGARE